MTEKLNVQEALIYIMVMMAAVEGKVSEVESRKIERMTQTLPLFRSLNIETLRKIADQAFVVLKEKNGIEKLVQLAEESLPLELYETCYALAAEIAAVDSSIGKFETRVLMMLRKKFQLDNLTAAAIERSILLRYKTLPSQAAS